MKVLLVAPQSGSSGGIARWTNHILSYYNSLDDKSVQIDIFDTARSEFIPDNASFPRRVKLALKDYGVIFKRFKSTLASDIYDVVHITSSASLGLLRDLLMIKMTHKRGTKAIVHFRFGRIPQLFTHKNWEYHLLTRVAKKADEVIVLDKLSFNVLIQNGYENIHLLPNPIAPGTLQCISDYGNLNREQGVILFVGHCIATKGVFELVHACKDIPGIRLRLIGAIEEDVKKQLLQLSENGGWLEMLGEKPYKEVLRQMMICDVFVLPTYTEGFPNVILEAMACGCPILTTPVGAIPEMLEKEGNNECGILVPPKDEDSLQKAIVHLLMNPAYKENCGKNAKDRVTKRYTMAAIWSQMVKIWNNA